MQIEKYGLVLRKIEETDLEIIRQWRNADHIRLNMAHQDMISRSQQKVWFEKLKEGKDFYFIFSKQEHAIGLVNVKDIDPQTLSGETGVFTGDSEFLGCPEPVAAVITLMDYCFDQLGLQTLRAKINLESKIGLSFNQTLGYVQADEVKSGFAYFEVNQVQYEKATAWIKKEFKQQEFT